MRTRDQAFLRMVERGIFASRRSPYLQLLGFAGCELGDVRSLVEREGIEGALSKLLAAGVYVSYEEFKGLVPVVRGSRTFAPQANDFDNPVLSPHYYSRSGGTHGKPSRTLIDLDHLAQMAPHWALWFGTHGVATEPLVFLNPYYPGAVGHQLICARFGNRFVKWFSTGGGGSVSYRLVSAYLHTLLRRMAGFPAPERVQSNQLLRVAEYLTALTARGRRPCINTAPSQAVRVSLAAQESGLSLQNVTFLLGAEPLTPARKEAIEASGAKATVTYGFSEGGNVGSQCTTPEAVDDIHISLDAYAAIQHPRQLDTGDAVGTLLLTALRPASPKVLLNTEIGDYAVLRTGTCGCEFDELGYNQHVHTVRSFGKLTGDGVTFIGADVFHLLEEVLPGTFGGSLLDYQLVELQDERGLPRYDLLVSPDLGPLDEQALIRRFLDELGRIRPPYRFMARQWAQTGALRVQRSRPSPTALGKVLPFRTLGPA